MLIILPEDFSISILSIINFNVVIQALKKCNCSPQNTCTQTTYIHNIQHSYCHNVKKYLYMPCQKIKRNKTQLLGLFLTHTQKCTYTTQGAESIDMRKGGRFKGQSLGQRQEEMLMMLSLRQTWAPPITRGTLFSVKQATR